MNTTSVKRKTKKKADSTADHLLKARENIDKKYSEKPAIYAGREEKLLNLVIEIIVKIILKEVL